MKRQRRAIFVGKRVLEKGWKVQRTELFTRIKAARNYGALHLKTIENYGKCIFRHLLQMHSGKRKKLLYVPGIISLIGVSILFYFIKPECHQKYALRFSLATDEPDDEFIRFSTSYVYAEAKKRKQMFVNLNTDSNQTGRKFDFIEQEIFRLACSYGEKPAVLIVNLNEETRFADFTQLINLPQKLGLKQYAYAGNSFYFFGLEKPIIDSGRVEVVGWSCGLMATEYISPKPTLLKVVIACLQTTFSKADAWWLGSYFLLIVFPSIIYNRKF